MNVANTLLNRQQDDGDAGWDESELLVMSPARVLEYCGGDVPSLQSDLLLHQDLRAELLVRRAKGHFTDDEFAGLQFQLHDVRLTVATIESILYVLRIRERRGLYYKLTELWAEHCEEFTSARGEQIIYGWTKGCKRGWHQTFTRAYRAFEEAALPHYRHTLSRMLT